MVKRGNRVVRAVSVAGVMAMSASAFAVSPAFAGENTSLHGVFNETGDGSDAGYDIHGSVKMTTGPAGTVVKVNVSGLDPTKEYGSHLHNLTCAEGGGGHYQNAVPGDVFPPNELWLSSRGEKKLVPNPGGVAHGAGSAQWEARISSDVTNARSVVVHEPVTGDRIACADLD